MAADSDTPTAENNTGEAGDGKLSVFGDLRRRKVFRVMGAYAVSAWLILQVVDVISGALPVPDWTMSAATAILALGFPIAAALSWAFQVTPEGVKLDMTTTDAMPVNRLKLIHFIDVVIILVLLLVVAWLTLSRNQMFAGVNDDTRLAVLPLENLSGSAADDYLSAGIADDIRTRLYELPQLLVAARSSSNALAEEGLDVRTIGERLGVEHVLEGSMLKDGDRIRVLVQLIDVQTGFARWSKAYNTRFEDVLAMQNNISLVVANQLEILLTPEVRKALASAPTEDPRIFGLYTQAQAFLDRPRARENFDHAEDLYRKAIDLDPDFVLGYVGLCRTSVLRFLYNRDAADLKQAESHCFEALAFDERLSEVHTTLGGMYLHSGRLEKARKEYETALDIDPKSNDAFVGIGRVFLAMGNVVDAEARLRAAIDLQPAEWHGYEQLGYLMLSEGRYDEAAQNYRRVLELSPDNASAFNSLGVANLMRGNFLEAAESFKRALKIAPSHLAMSNTGSMYYFAGQYREAADMFRQAAEEAVTDFRMWGNLADSLRFVEGRNDDVRQLYTRASNMALQLAEVTGHDASTLIPLAWYQANLGNAREAEQYLAQSRKIETVDSQQAYLRAMCYAKLGQAEKAEASILKALAMGFPRALVEATPEFTGLNVLTTDT